MLFDVPNYGRSLPPLKGSHKLLVPRNIKLPRHTTMIGYIWVKSCGKWLIPEAPTSIFVKGIKIAHAIKVRRDVDNHRHHVLFRLWEGRPPLQLPPPKPPSFDGDWD